jgi:hypothetical protein
MRPENLGEALHDLLGLAAIGLGLVVVVINVIIFVIG